MQNIEKFILNNSQSTLTCCFNDTTQSSLTYEYLRVFSPTEQKKTQSKKSPSTTPQVFHKKSVKIIAIEPLGKHGYRFVFDDNYSDVFSDNNLADLVKQHEQLWPEYELSLTSVNSREESINFKAIT
jgi:DUF971 family protein